jgi:hypothetical protein
MIQLNNTLYILAALTTLLIKYPLYDTQSPTFTCYTFEQLPYTKLWPDDNIQPFL